MMDFLRRVLEGCAAVGWCASGRCEVGGSGWSGLRRGGLVGEELVLRSSACTMSRCIVKKYGVYSRKHFFK